MVDSNEKRVLANIIGRLREEEIHDGLSDLIDQVREKYLSAS